MNLSNNTKAIISRSFDLDREVSAISEAELVELLAERIDELLRTRLEYFFHLMYRLDIPEGPLHEALQSGRPTPSIAVAKLIIARQLEKQRSREKYGDGMGDFDT